MKKLLFLSIPLFLVCACNQPSTIEKTGITSNNNDIPKDSRPKSQLKFLKLLDDIYSHCLEQNNEITLKEAADSGKVKLTNFITDSLKSEFKDWKARVYNIELSELDGSTTVTFMMSRHAQFSEQDPELDAIFFKQLFFDKSTRDKIKAYKKNDDVLLEGAFSTSDRDEQGNIEFSSRADTFKEGEAFSEAVFDIVLLDVQPSK